MVQQQQQPQQQQQQQGGATAMVASAAPLFLMPWHCWVYTAATISLVVIVLIYIGRLIRHCRYRGAYKPLLTYYARRRVRYQPTIRVIPKEQVPLPYRSLLCHHENITPKLQDHWSTKVSLRVLDKHEHTDERILSRWILLERNNGGVSVNGIQSDGYCHSAEFAAINIHFNNIPVKLHDDLRAGVIPFGLLLRENGVEQVCTPVCYFVAKVDATLSDALGLSSLTPVPREVYGRCNLIRSPMGRVLAETVEILPPTPLQPLPTTGAAPATSGLAAFTSPVATTTTATDGVSISPTT